MKEYRYSPLHILCGNGWEWHHYNDDWLIQMDGNEDYGQYTLDVLGYGYTTTVRAAVAEYSRHLEVNGHYGVLWLDAARYENRPPYEEQALEDMKIAILNAEDNLLAIGMPFSPNYIFHGDIETKKKRNERLRLRYGLDKKERIGND